MKYAVETKGLTKSYKDFTLGGIDLAIPCGFSAALIGANGAGKTTLIDTICGVIGKTGGSVNYFGRSDDIDDAGVRNAIGYCTSVNMFPLDWTAKRIASVMELAFGNFSRDRFVSLCGRLKVGSPDEKKQKKLYKLSDGNKMRLALAAVLARDTELLVLDEPASPLDPLGRDMLCELFREYLAERDGERTILFSTHNIADMEYAADYAVFMSKGRVIEQGFVEELKEKYRTVRGDGSLAEKARPLMLSLSGNSTAFEGLCLAENAEKLNAIDTAVEIPTLQQLSVGLLRYAESDEK